MESLSIDLTSLAKWSTVSLPVIFVRLWNYCEIRHQVHHEGINFTVHYEFVVSFTNLRTSHGPDSGGLGRERSFLGWNGGYKIIPLYTWARAAIIRDGWWISQNIWICMTTVLLLSSWVSVTVSHHHFVQPWNVQYATRSSQRWMVSFKESGHMVMLLAACCFASGMYCMLHKSCWDLATYSIGCTVWSDNISTWLKEPRNISPVKQLSNQKV